MQMHMQSSNVELSVAQRFAGILKRFSVAGSASKIIPMELS